MGNPVEQTPVHGDFLPHRKSSVISHEVKIPQNNAREVTAIIWRYEKERCGHAALQLRTKMEEKVTQILSPSSQFRYVSFWPARLIDENNRKGGKIGIFHKDYLVDLERELSWQTQVNLSHRTKKLKDGTLTPFVHKGKQVAYQIDGQFINANDIIYTEKWGLEADDFVSMPAFDINQMGLDMRQIVAWCIQHKNSELFCYDFVSNKNNCASIAWQALNAGGGEAYASLFGNIPNHWVYITPNDLRDYAKQIQEGIKISQNDYINVRQITVQKLSENVALMGAAKKGWQNLSELYGYNDWINESYVKWGIRGSNIKEIDRAIAEYHKYNWTGLTRAEELSNYTNKLRQLLKILHNINIHFKKNVNEKRDPAYLALAIQTVKVIDNLKHQSLKPWDTSNYFSEKTDDVVSPSRNLGQKILKRA
jgi:hypothetical protein